MTENRSTIISSDMMGFSTTQILLALLLIAIICSGAPTTEINQQDMKQQPLEEDMDEFYKDQEHLVPYRHNGTWTATPGGGIWTTVTQFWNINELLAILARFGLPINSIRCSQGVCYPLALPALLQEDKI